MLRLKPKAFSVLNYCPGCALKPHARQQVIGRGSIPAKLLFLGEGPGKSEDLLGEPFIGPSGRLLEQMMQDAARLADIAIPSHYITNVVMCRPWIWDEDDKDHGENREPFKEEVLACTPNVMRVAEEVKPQYVIFVGKTAERYYKKEFPHHLRILHPAFHLRYGGQTSPYYPQDVRLLSEIFEELI